VCGSDNKRWTGIAIVDTEGGAEDIAEHSFSYDGFHEDPIALNAAQDANFPITDARDYFLAIFKIRMAQVLEEWRYLVRSVERSIERSVFPYSPSNKRRMRC